jgi:hypothetical protein
MFETRLHYQLHMLTSDLIPSVLQHVQQTQIKIPGYPKREI